MFKMGLVSTYRYLVDDLGDKRVSKWLFMDNPFPALIIVVLYIYIVKVAGPKFMENRKPYNLTKFIQYYNIFQILACATLFYGVATTDFFKSNFYGCVPVDYSNNPMAVRQANIYWWILILKFIELIETVLFVLRKKFNQISNLHVYHHSVLICLAWIGTKYAPGGMALFPMLINFLVHIIMYLYYFLSTFGPNWQQKLGKWKNKLTIIQMIQFCIIIIHIAQPLYRTDCDFPLALSGVLIPNVIVIFYLFYDFYKNSYTKKVK